MRSSGLGRSRDPLPASVGASNSATSVLFSPKTGAPIPLASRHRPAVARYSRAPIARSRLHHRPEREVCRRCATQDTFLWRGALLEPFAGSPFGACPAWVQRSSSIRSAKVTNPRELGPVRLPQPQPRLASRARRALTRFCNFSTRNPDTPTKDRSSHEPNAFARLVRSAKPCGLPSCEQYGTETSLSGNSG